MAAMAVLGSDVAFSSGLDHVQAAAVARGITASDVGVCLTSDQLVLEHPERILNLANCKTEGGLTALRPISVVRSSPRNCLPALPA